MLEVHAAALEGVDATYHEFLLRYKASARTVYAIVEGKEDPMFYRGLIEGCLPTEWKVELVPAGRRENVTRAVSAFDWTRFSRRRVCFFVDRDLSDFLPGLNVQAENVYVTDNYSIENDLVTPAVFMRLLEEAMNVTGLRPKETEDLLEKFRIADAQFREAMVPVMAQAILWRRNGQRPCLDQIRPRDILDVTDGSVSPKRECCARTVLLARVAASVDLTVSCESDVAQVEREFRQKRGVERFIRGKYLLWFLVEFAHHVHKSLSRHVPRIRSSPKPRISLGVGNAMVLAAPRVRCPTSLRAFLDGTYGQYLKERGESGISLESTVA
jgi:hypothetical protein